MEQFKKIKNYENYSVSRNGKVINNTTGKELKHSYHFGYSRVTLCCNGKNKRYRVHRLVAEAFIPNPENKNMVDHIDNDRANNKVCNLRWATPSENAMNMKLRPESKTKVKGVYAVEDGRYTACIGFQNRIIYLGHFANLEEAKQARQKKANELFGVYTNHIEKIKSELELLEEELNNL